MNEWPAASVTAWVPVSTRPTHQQFHRWASTFCTFVCRARKRVFWRFWRFLVVRTPFSTRFFVGGCRTSHLLIQFISYHMYMCCLVSNGRRGDGILTRKGLAGPSNLGMKLWKQCSYCQMALPSIAKCIVIVASSCILEPISCRRSCVRPSTFTDITAQACLMSLFWRRRTCRSSTFLYATDPSRCTGNP